MGPSNSAVIAHCLNQLFAVRQPFAARFYRRLFEEIPEARSHFTTDMKRQEMMLFAVLSMAVKGFASGRKMHGELFEFGRVHRRAGVTEEMFPVFGAVFLEVLIEFLPDIERTELAPIWWQVYTRLYEPIVDGMRSDSVVPEQTQWIIDAKASHVA